MGKHYNTRSIAVASYLATLGYEPQFQIDTDRWVASWHFEEGEKMRELAIEYQEHFDRLKLESNKVRGR